MNRLKLNFIVEVLMFLALSANILGAVFEVWELHKAAGTVLIVLVAVHLVLHQRQIFAMAKSYFMKTVGREDGNKH